MQSPLECELDELDTCKGVDLYAVLDKILDKPVANVTSVCPQLTYITRKDPHLPLWTVESIFSENCHRSQGPGTRLKYVIARIRLLPRKRYKIYGTLPPRNRLYTIRKAYGRGWAVLGPLEAGV